MNVSRYFRFVSVTLLVMFIGLFMNATPAFANCDGWASPGTTHRNNGNGCYYTCNGDSWSGPTKCDGGGDGKCQGCDHASKEDAERAVKQRQKEAENKIKEQGGLNSEATKKSSSRNTREVWKFSFAKFRSRTS
ncbi:hypothetical protein LRY60_05215 [Candidatus Woesebacteria bacterium]|nr:hypothetical protein [Candidatus Woesebacteria bacterium]